MQVNALAAAAGRVPSRCSPQPSPASPSTVSSTPPSHVEDTGAPDGSRTVVNSGNQSSSRLGFRGTEDLGNGLKAIFNLEAGVALDTGAADSRPVRPPRRGRPGRRFRFSLTLGREYTPDRRRSPRHRRLRPGLLRQQPVRLQRQPPDPPHEQLGQLQERVAGAASSLLAAYSAGETDRPVRREPDGRVAPNTRSAGLYAGRRATTRFERLVTGDDKELTVGAGSSSATSTSRPTTWRPIQTGANNKFEQMQPGRGLHHSARTSSSCNLQQQRAAKTAPRAMPGQWPTPTRCPSAPTCTRPTPRMRNNGQAAFGLNSARPT